MEIEAVILSHSGPVYQNFIYYNLLLCFTINEWKV